MTATLPKRAMVPHEHTWNLASLFASPDDWEEAYQAIERELPALATFQGRLGEAPATLVNWFATTSRLAQAMGKIFCYAQLQFDTDTTSQTSAALVSRAQGLGTRLASAVAFAGPELLALDPAHIAQMLDSEPQLATYRQFFANLQRQRDYVRSAEVEDVLALAGDALNVPWNSYQMLAEGDLDFGTVADAAAQPYQVARGTIDELLHSPDRTLRKAAWNAYADGFLKLRNTLGALIGGNVQANVFRMRTRRYASSCAAALSESNIPVAVYENVLAACSRHMPIWHRYWELRRRALGLDRIEVCDTFAPLTSNQPTVPYAQAVEWVCAGLAPLGDDYVRVARAGLTSARWVDIYPNQGKQGGAYSNAAYGVHPYILMNYSNDLGSMSTLAHELGHAMHSYLTNTSQPYVYASYKIFVAEVASNFNQALTRAFLLRTYPERDFQLAVLEETMENFHRYLFLMPILARFELRMHEEVEQGRALTPDSMSDMLLDLFREGYGPAGELDGARVGITWAQFPHLYASFYVYQYASGIAAATMLADQVLQGDGGAVERYLQFLRAGDSCYPLDALKLAGVDMTEPEPMDRAFKVLEGYIDQIDQLLTARA